MAEEKVIPFKPASNKPANSARNLELERVTREFKSLGRSDNDVFRHLAQKMHGYLAEVEALGKKTGKIGKIIGGYDEPSARHRTRYAWDGTERNFSEESLCKLPGNWLLVLERCAEALNRAPDELLLDALAGTRLRQASGPSEYSAGSWMQDFHGLMHSLQERLTANREFDGLLDYLAGAHLEFQEDGSLLEMDEPALAWFRADIPEWPSILDQLPYARICTDLPGGMYNDLISDSHPELQEQWLELLSLCNVMDLVESHQFVLSPRIRRGLALIPTPEGQSPLALFRWPTSVLMAYPGGNPFDPATRSMSLPSQAVLTAGKLLNNISDIYTADTLDRVSFAQFGTAGFDMYATETFPDLIGSILHDEHCWDPMFADGALNIEWASSAPRASLAATIERNLLFADEAGVPEMRLDRLLEAGLMRMASAVRQHRISVDQIVRPARLKFLESLPPSSGGAADSSK